METNQSSQMKYRFSYTFMRMFNPIEIGLMLLGRR